MAKLDPIQALQLAAIVAAGVAAYLVVTKIAKTGAKVGDAIGSVATDVKNTIVTAATETFNPASEANIVNRVVTSTPLGQDISSKFGDFLGSIFDPKGYAEYQANLAKSNTSNVKKQAKLLAPTGAGGGQSSPSYAATDPRRLDRPASYVNPLADVRTQDFNAMGDFPLNF